MQFNWFINFPQNAFFSQLSLSLSQQTQTLWLQVSCRRYIDSSKQHLAFMRNASSHPLGFCGSSNFCAISSYCIFHRGKQQTLARMMKPFLQVYSIWTREHIGIVSCQWSKSSNKLFVSCQKLGSLPWISTTAGKENKAKFPRKVKAKDGERTLMVLECMVKMFLRPCTAL